MKKVALDLGHGGSDPGTVHNGVVEADYVYATGVFLRHALAKLGVEVLFSRTPDQDPTFAERARFAIDHLVDGVICLHVNAGDPREHGPLAFHRDDDVTGMQAAQTFIREIRRGGRYQVDDHTSKPMKWQTHVARPTGWTTRAWRCMIQQPLPVCLIELEYCSHEPSAKWLLSDAGQARITDALVNTALAMVD